jgi:hypothetical protein
MSADLQSRCCRLTPLALSCLAGLLLADCSASGPAPPPPPPPRAAFAPPPPRGAPAPPPPRARAAPEMARRPLTAAPRAWWRG